MTPPGGVILSEAKYPFYFYDKKTFFAYTRNDREFSNH